MTFMVVSDRVQRRVNEFQQRCGEYGEVALHLAYHAALPVALNAELLHFLRINFFLDPPEVLPYTVEFEFLLSPLCREIDEGLYEIEPEIRNVLLAGLTQTYGTERIRDIATLLWQYVEHRSPWEDRVELERAQQLTALNFLNPEKAHQWLETVGTEVSQEQVAAREWFVAMRQDIESQAKRIEDIYAIEESQENETPTNAFFISYTSQDQAWADWIAWTLEVAGYSVIALAWNFRPSDNVVFEMQRAASRCQKMIVVLSEKYLQSAYAEPEGVAVFAQIPQSAGRKLIPVRVDECKPTGILSAIVYLDLVGVPEREAQKRLLEAVNGKVFLQEMLGQVPFPGTAEPVTTKESEQPLERGQLEQQRPVASLRSLSNSQEWTMPILENPLRIGRSLDNDLQLPSDEEGVSREHAEISCHYSDDNDAQLTYLLRDFSRFGTWILLPEGREWQRVHRQEVILSPETQLKFGSKRNSAFEFSMIEPEATKEELEVFSRFQEDLESGREAAAWLDKNRTQLAETGGILALNQFADIKQAALQEQINQFYFSIEQFLERISHSLTWGNYDVLDEPAIPMIFESRVYEIAFRKIQQKFPARLGEEAQKQFVDCIDYLVEGIGRFERRVEKSTQEDSSMQNEAVRIPTSFMASSQITSGQLLQKHQALIQLVEEAKTADFFELARLAGLNPKEDFSGADLKWIDLRSAQLSRANFINTNLSGANLTNANLQEARLIGAQLMSAIMEGAILDYANLVNINMQGANLVNASLVSADLTRANLTQADLSHADLQRATLTAAMLERVHLSEANLSHANLRRADLSKADLSGASLYSADLSNCDLRWANLSETNLVGATLTRAIFAENPGISKEETLVLRQKGAIFYVY